ncbi:MAG: HEAT repeat domain-containing protein [Planctomycetota bacterium]|jgi:HEAT repeat protein
MNTRSLTALTALVVGLTLPAHATTLAETTLGKLISGAELIVIGKVSRLVEVPAGERAEGEESVPTLRVAEVEVLQCLKGLPRPKRVWFLAEGTSRVDRSHAVKGEKALFFLADLKGQIRENDGDVNDPLRAPAFWRHVKELTGGAPFLQLCWAGHGRMPVEQVEGVEFAALCAWHVHLPTDTPTIPGADPRLSDLERRVPFGDLIGRVKLRLAPIKSNVAPVSKLLEELDADTDLHPSEKAYALLKELGEEAVPALFELLDHPAFPRRDTVAEALIWIAGPEPDALLKGMRSKDVARRRAAAFALEHGADVRIVGGDEPVLEALLAAVDDPDPEVRAHTVGALVACGVDESAVTALADKSPRVRRSAARSLLESSTLFVDIEEFPTEKAETALLPMATDDNVDVRREVWEALAHVAGPATLPAALKALEDSDRVVRVSGIRSLGRTRAPEAAKRLIQFLESEDSWARRAAVNALGVGKFAAGVGPLTRALGDPDEVLVHNAVDALGEIGPPAAPAVPALERLLETTGDTNLSYDVKKALEKIGE